MQVDQVGALLCRERCDDITDLLYHGRIHFPIQQYLAATDNQPFCPNGYQNRACDTHQGIQPGPPEKPTAYQCDDGQN